MKLQRLVVFVLLCVGGCWCNSLLRAQTAETGGPALAQDDTSTADTQHHHTTPAQKPQDSSVDSSQSTRMLSDTAADWSISQRHSRQSMVTQQQQQHQHHHRRRRNAQQKNGKRKSRDTEDRRSKPHRTAIHLVADSAEYINYSKDVRLPQLQYWVVTNDSTSTAAAAAGFRYDKGTGHLRVKQDGFYYVYAQITYSNSETISAFSVRATQPDTRLAKCVVTQQQQTTQQTTGQQDQQDDPAAHHQEHHVEHQLEAVYTSTCHTSTVVFLQKDRSLYISNDEQYFRPMTTSPWATFWGAFKL